MEAEERMDKEMMSNSIMKSKKRKKLKTLRQILFEVSLFICHAVTSLFTSITDFYRN